MKWERMYPGTADLRIGEIFCQCEKRFNGWNSTAEFLPNDCGTWITFRRGGFKTLADAKRWAESQIPRLRKLVAEDEKGGA